MTRAARVGRAAASAALLASVALAFADSSIVVLGLPELLREFDVSITAVAWVVTSFNLALALAALALVRPARRLPPRRLACIGLATFLAASLACAVAPGIWLLVACRAVQGVGGAMLLVGALPLVRSTALWAAAGVVGAALGPALGGLLTEAFSWRAIFVVQVPVAALGLLALLGLHARRDQAAAATGSRRVRYAATAALALVSAALVGLLFLAVIELVNVRLLSPLQAGVVVSAVAAATLAAQPLADARRRGMTAAGIALLAGGLAGMALLPSSELAWPVLALAVGGAGYGIAAPRLTRVALGGGESPSDGAVNVWTRHAGLVAGLVVLTPLLAGDLATAGDRAERRGISLVLDAPVPVTSKVQLAMELAPLLARPAREGLPRFADALAEGGSVELVPVGRQLDETVRASVSLGFRRAYLAASALALLALAPLALLRRPRPSSARAPIVALAVVAALLTAELAAGAAAYGTRPRLFGVCEQRAPPPGIALAGLDRIACALDTTREELLGDLARRGVDAAALVRQLERAGSSRLPAWLLRQLVALFD